MIERGKKKDIGRELDDLRDFPFEARVFVENSLAWEEMLDFEKFHDEPNKKGRSELVEGTASDDLIVWEKSLIVKNEKNAVSLKREGCLYWGSRGEGTKGNGAKWDEILVKSLRFCQKMDFLKMLCYTAKKRLHR